MSDQTTDRGALPHLSFHRCARGFILMSGGFWDRDGLPRTIYAFDRIEDLGAWLVEQYSDPSEPECRGTCAGGGNG